MITLLPGADFAANAAYPYRVWFPRGQERVADNVEEFLVRGRSRRAWRCRVLLTLIECMPLFTHGRPFSKLGRAERRRLIEERYVGGAHAYRLCAKVRYLVLMGMYGDAAAPRATQYVPLAERARFRPSPLASSDVVPLSAVRSRRADRPAPPSATVTSGSSIDEHRAERPVA